jgi:uncharacterized metal-binding protein YceD (DUF177 family)
MPWRKPDEWPMTLENPEFSHTVPLSEIGGKAVHIKLAADEAQRAALAKRFALLSLDVFSADVAVSHDGDAILADGRFAAELVQACVATGTAVPAKLDEAFNVRFVAENSYSPDAEIELGDNDCDTLFHDGRIVDLGEVAAQSLGLAINPYPRSPDAEATLRQAGVKGEHEAGPFAALAAFKKDG